MNLQALLASRPNGLRSQVLPKALSAWSPGVKAESAADENTISIMDVIGEDWYGGVSAARIDAALRYIGRDNPVTVYINSPGGDVFEGLAIYNLLKDHKGKVTVKIMGLAASAASVIAMAGDEIQIPKSAFYMIHNCWVCACGDQHYMRSTADYLDQFDDVVAEIYADRTGHPADEMARWMDEETWLNGKRAVEEKFADSLMGEPAKGEDSAAAFTHRTLQALLAQTGLTGDQTRALLDPVFKQQSGTAQASGFNLGEAASLSQQLKGVFS